MTIRCHNCRNRLIQKSDGKINVRARGVISFDENGVCHARCHFCKAAVVLPLELSKSDDSGKNAVFVVELDKVSSG